MMRALCMLPAVLLAISACVGDSPESRFYLLDAVPPEGEPPAVTGAPVVVDEVTIPEHLDRPEMVRRTGEHAMDVDGIDRWGAPLDDMVRDVLIEDLALRLPEALVPPDNRPPDDGPVRVLVVRIDEFTAWADGRVALEAAWSVRGADDEEPALQDRETIEVTAPGAGAGAEGQARRMSQALGVLADRIVTAMADGG